MKNSPLALTLLLLIFSLLSACGGEKSSSSVTTPPVADAADQASPNQVSNVDPKEKIVDILSDYYTDLAAENIDETKYFAPELDQFFSSRSISREQVGKSLRSSFDAVEDRHITFDPKSMRITPNAKGYEIVFKGQSIHTKSADGEQVNATFSNKVAFDKDFKIIAYGGADDKPAQNTRSLAPRDAAPNAVASAQPIAKTVLQEFKTGKFSKSKSYIHPKYGLYLIGQPGAYSVPYHLNSFDEVFKKAPWLKEGTDMHADMTAENIPGFTCEGDDYFDKQGCFIAEKSNFKNVSQLMKALRQAEFEEFGPSVVKKATDLEKLVKVEVVETKSAIAFYYGEEAGKWYLLIIDMASYGCSA